MAVIFLVALSVRFFHLWQISRSPFVSTLIGDARVYDRWAQEIAAGDWVGRDVFYQAPLYPYALGTVYAVFGHDPMLVRIVQAIGGSLSCVLLASAASRLFSRQAGVVAGLLLALYPPAVFFDGLVQKTSLDTFLVCAIIWLLARLAGAPGRPTLTALLGVVAAALCLNRENALVIVAVLLAWLVANPSGRHGMRWRTALTFTLGVAVLLGPVALRNYAVGGGIYLTTSQFGPNFYIGNHPGADGTYQALRIGRGTADHEREDATEIAQRAAGRTLTPREVSGYWAGRALDFIRNEPLAWARLMVRKARLLVNREELVDTESQESAAEWSLFLRAGRRILHFGVLLPIAVAGAWLARERLRRLWVLPAMASVYAATVVAFYVFARYRFPLVPFMMLAAAPGLTQLPALFRGSSGSGRERRALIVTVTAVAIVANWPMVSPAAMQAVSENSLGAALHADGRSAEALPHFERAVALNPAELSAHVNMGIALQGTGRPADASLAFARAVALHPDLGEAHYFLGKSLFDSGRPTQAIEELIAAVNAMPESMEVRTALGVALASQQRFAEATVQFREVASRSPVFPNASWNLGSALLSSGNLRDALPLLEDAVRRDPQNAAVRTDLADAYNRRGIALAAAGSLPDAIADFESALRAAPDFADARKNLTTARGFARR